MKYSPFTLYSFAKNDKNGKNGTSKKGFFRKESKMLGRASNMI